MAVALGMVIVVVALAVCAWLAVTALNQVKQVRAELDQTQRQLNEVQREVTDLKAAAEAAPVAPPPLPRARSSGLQDLREQLRAAHREDASSEE